MLDFLVVSVQMGVETQSRAALFPRPTPERGFSCFRELSLTYIVYLDEFGHVGPYISRSDLRHNDSPIFGLAGFALPIDQVRGFGTWFFQRKNELLKWEITQNGGHPATWEKKGSSLYTVSNVKNYPELPRFTFRLFNKIHKLGGFLFYVGDTKLDPVEDHNSNKLYRNILKEAIKRLDQHFSLDCNPRANFIVVLDEHSQRDSLLTESAIAMYSSAEPRRGLIEQPFQVESHRYQTMQAADWIAGLVGRLGAAWVAGQEYPENEIFRKFFEARLNQKSDVMMMT